MKKILYWKKMYPCGTVSLLTVRGICISDHAVELSETAVHLTDGMSVADVGYDTADDDSGNTESDGKKQKEDQG